MSSAITNALVVLFWVSSALAVYAYVGYPLVLWACSRAFGRIEVPPPSTPPQGASLPFLSVLIAAYNEAEVIEARVRNLLDIDYPADRFEIVVASDGSSDRTCDLVRAFRRPNVRVLEYQVRRGKASVLNDAIAAVKGDLVLLSDANTFTDPQAAARLARWFQDESVGVVCGRLVLVDPVSGANVDGLYWRYENVLKLLESRLGALLGANGAIYAIRRPLFGGIRPDTAVDDFVIPLLTRLRTGCRLVYDASALAFEETPPVMTAEFRRRSRIGAGGFQSLSVLWPLLDPRQGWVAFAFWSHKILRWTCPIFLIVAFLTSLVLIGVSPIITLAAAAQTALYALAAAGYFISGSGRAARLVRLTSMFAGMNLALFVGLWLWISGRQQGTWQRTAR